jgi:hypothetical protein
MPSSVIWLTGVFRSAAVSDPNRLRRTSRTAAHQEFCFDSSTGRYTNTMIGAPFHHVGYAVSANKLVGIDSDPVASNQGVLWQAVGLWER